ncbi:zinc finger protein 831 [Tachysurus fulvidraco]|uniref:zinc finger protein 831 n=1 Tax=Tachysurus fulvidraco TaxID=1234273 RepID=UPI001FF02072|nr:zinc finger protein 831 [Tachysurus fulvidraco]XP_027010641.2 zinc finger protein 831 [Tachysurus fulvidraco]
MATGKQGFVRATEPQHLVSVQREKEMHVQAPLPAMYIQAVSGLSSYPQSQPAAVQESAVIPLSVPMMYANQTLPLLTLHIASGAGLQQQRPEPPASSSRPKSQRKHVCPHCGRDCLKPSVLEKHLRCHTGERPYPCPTCGISFKTQSNLYKHKRTQAHARLSSESGKGTFSSQESTESSRENCRSPSLELQNEDSGDTNRNDGALPAVATSTATSEEVKSGSETEWALCKAAVVGVIASPAHGQQVISHTITQRVPQLPSDAAPTQVKCPNRDGRAPLAPNRIPLQRQEALFPKSQSHDSTDSGFSESNEQHSTSSPGATVNDPSMELDEPETSVKISDEATDDTKNKVSLQEKQKLEKHILKLISDNSVVMDDQHLVNVRPRKTGLSKQGSIDLPMRYTYKDSFHFEIKSSKHLVSGSQKQDKNGRAFYSSMPTQYSTSLEHAPLTRSSSLPFSMGIPNSDSTVSPCQVDNIPLSRRCSAGHIYPFKSIDQHTPSHRSLVRQVAVDGLSAVEGSLMERGSLSSLSSDGDCTDTTSESPVKRCRRKKAEKFAYNKWYMYGGGTFKKLYNTEKDSVLKSRKSTLSPEQTDSQGIQISQQIESNSSASVSGNYISCSAPSLSPALTTQASSQALSSYVLVQNTPVKQSTGQHQQTLTKQTNVPCSDLSIAMNVIKGMEEKGRASDTQLSTLIPSERKKQKTDEQFSALAKNSEALIRMQQCSSRQINTNLCQSLQSECCDVPQKSSLTSPQRDNGLSLNRQDSFTNLSSSSNQRQHLFKRHSSPLFAANISGTSASPSVSSSISSVSQAKTSFLPKYQLKIPVLTDGMSDPCLGKSSLLNPSSTRQNVSLNQQTATTSPSSQQNQASMTMMSPGQGQGTLCVTAITKATSMTSAVYSCQNDNAYTSTYTSTSVSLASPLAFTDLSLTVSTTHSSISPVSHSSTSTKHSQVHAGNVASVQDSPVTSVVIPTQSLGVPTPVLPGSTDGIPLEISGTEVQGSQDTFYVQTADLQIVMQLISDEQLALIEPQIEMQDYKTTGGQCFLRKDPETSGTDTTPTGVSQKIHKQCSGDAGTKLAVEQGNVNRSVLSNIPDITLMSSGSTVTEHKARSTKSAQDIYFTNTGIKGVISRSPSKSEHGVSALLDSRTFGQQCKRLGSTPEESTVPKGPETVGSGISAESYLKQIPSEKVSKTSAGKSRARNESEGSKSSVSDHILRNYSTSIICNIQQSCQDTTHNHGTSHTILGSANNTALSSEGKLVKVKSSPPEISVRNICPNLQPVQMTVQQHKSLALTKSVEKQTTETNTSCISGASSAQGLPLTAMSSSNHDEPIQHKTCQSSNASSIITKAISTRSVLACRVSPQQPLNQTGAFSGDRSTYDKNQTSASGRSGQHSILQVWSKTEDVKTITSSFESHGPILKCLKEESIKCALAPGGILHVAQDSFTGPSVSRSLQNSKLNREAGTARQKWIPLENKRRGGDGTERVRSWDPKSTWTKEEEEEEEESMEKNKEEAKCTEIYHKAVKPRPDLSTSPHRTNAKASSPEIVSITPTPAICVISNFSSESTNKVRENSPGVNLAPKHIEQSNKKVKKHISLGCHESLTPLSKGPGDMRHLLAHSSPLVNATQEEVKKETQTKNLTHSTSTQVQRPLPKQEADGTAQISVAIELGTTSLRNTDHCQIIKTSPAHTRPSCLNQTNSSCIHPNPTCTSRIHSNPTEHNAPHSYMEEEEEEEEEEKEEERSSSSDDEGKLVIELE